MPKPMTSPYYYDNTGRLRIMNEDEYTELGVAEVILERVLSEAEENVEYYDSEEYNQEEVLEEGEGTLAVTPKEKQLAAHHGDPKRITQGDVLKARLKSIAAKKKG
jgi:hypothetical protein